MPFSDRAKAGLKAFIQSVVGNPITGARADYLARYPCKVVSQNADGTLELRPDNSKLPPFSRVPIATAFPGMSLTVSPGARCKLEFSEGDPARPFVAIWESGNSVSVTLHATTVNVGTSADTVVLAGGVLPVARAGDTAGPYPVTPGNPKVLG